MRGTTQIEELSSSTQKDNGSYRSLLLKGNLFTVKAPEVIHLFYMHRLAATTGSLQQG